MALVNPTFGLMERIEVRRIFYSRCPLRLSLGNIDDLAKSIEEKGLLQPIIVKPFNANSFEVIAGNRRLAACKLAKWKKMPCYIADYDDMEALEVSIVENVQHESLNYLEEARAFKRYVDVRGYGATSELAKRIGKSPTYVSRRIAILDLPDALQKELLRCRKSSSIAQELMPLNKEISEEVGKLILGSNVTAAQVRRTVKDLNKKEDDEDLFCSFSSEDKRLRMIDRALTKSIVSFKICMMRLDETLDYLDEDEWILWDALMQYRHFTHQQIDSLLKLEKKIKRLPRFSR